MMALTSFRFAVFFAVVYVGLWIIKWILGKKGSFPAVNKIFLLIVSYAFMTLADWRFAICILALTAVTYFSALWKSKKVLVAGIVILNFLKNYYSINLLGQKAIGKSLQY